MKADGMSNRESLLPKKKLPFTELKTLQRLTIRKESTPVLSFLGSKVSKQSYRTAQIRNLKVCSNINECLTKVCPNIKSVALSSVENRSLSTTNDIELRSTMKILQEDSSQDSDNEVTAEEEGPVSNEEPESKEEEIRQLLVIPEHFQKKVSPKCSQRNLKSVLAEAKTIGDVKCGGDEIQN